MADTATSTNPGERARDGLEHLQAAARELIAAARAALDVAEGLIDDPEVVATVVGRWSTHAHARAEAADVADDEPSVERITVV